MIDVSYKNSIIDDSRYVDLTTDSGYKAVFCDPENKEIVVSFINSIMPPEKQIVDYHLVDREKEGLSIYNKSIRLDFHCKDQNGSDFIVELQKTTNENFYLRTLAYAAMYFQANILRGDNEFKTVKPVYLIAILCEDLKEPEFQGLDDLVLWYQMCEKTHKCFAKNGINVIFVGANKAAKSYSDCKSDTEKFCHIIYNIGESNEDPNEYDGVFSKLVTAAEIAGYSIDKKRQYRADMLTELDRIAEKNEFHRRGFVEGLAEGEAKGKAEGFAEANRATAKALLADGLSVEKVSSYTGLSINELKSL